MNIMGARHRIVGGISLAVMLGLLSACANIDDALFGTSANASQAAEPTQPAATEPVPPPAPAPVEMASNEPAEAPADESEGSAIAETAPAPSPATSSSAPVAPAPAPAPAMSRTESEITAVPIEPGSNTGTAVSNTVAGLRSDLVALEQRVVSHGQALEGLRASAVQFATIYHEHTAQITARLQIGTTRGNPELVSRWNAAQTALDALTTNINALNGLGRQITDDASHAHYLVSQIQATLNISGAVDEDHRQLHVLEDETDQTIVLIDRLVHSVTDTVQRQVAYVANERASLTTLASAIKNGEMFGGDLGLPMMSLMSSPVRTSDAGGGSPLVTIRFDHPSVDYQQILYTALSQALQSRPNASFSVVGVSPTRGSASAVQLAQTDARRHAQDVLRSMTDMGVPPARLGLSSATDPSVRNSEVRVFVR